MRRSLPVGEQRLYWVWAAMIQRCTNPRNKAFCRYGGAGIQVCDRWRTFANFRSDMGVPSAGLTLERVDGKSGYNPSNCVWATRAEQNSNRPSFCRYVTIDGQTMVLKEAWRRYSPHGLTYRAVVKRLARGWPIFRALGGVERAA